MPEVFISYSRKDREIAEALGNSLKNRGFDVWWDAEILGGVDFRKAIRSELEVAKAVIVIWSTDSVNSRFVVDEADYAAATGRLIPTRTSTLSPNEIPLGFRGIQIHIVTEIERLVDALKKLGVVSSAANVGGTGPGQLPEALAVELSAWNFVQQREAPALVRDFLARYPNGQFSILAKHLLAELEWKRIASLDDREAVETYLREFPSMPHSDEARKRLTSPANAAPPMKSLGGVMASRKRISIAVSIIGGLFVAMISWKYLVAAPEEEVVSEYVDTREVFHYQTASPDLINMGFKIFKGKEVDGDPIGNQSEVGAEECLNLCSNNSKCFAVQTIGDSCYMYKSVDKMYVDSWGSDDNPNFSAVKQ